MRVVIAGAGLAGLTLAHRMVSAGADVTVHERDPEPFARPQGYRITVDRDGLAALRRSLPAPVLDLILQTSGPPGGHFRFTNEHLRDAFVLSFDPGPDAERQVDRDVLRRILLGSLDAPVHYGVPVSTVHAGADGPEVVLADGTRDGADLVVVADGISSVLAPAVFPDAVPVDTGRGGIYGLAPLYREGHSVLPEAVLPEAVLPESLLDSGFLALLPTAGSAFFFTTMRFREAPAAAFARALPALEPPTREPYVMWGLVLPPDELARVRTDTAPAALVEHARHAVRRAHPLVRSLVESADPTSVLLSRFSAGTRPGPAAVDRVAVLGDAIHPMPPFGAHGGNTALRDAAVLGDHLVGRVGTVDEAVRAYHREMAGYAFDAVDAAVAQMNRLSTSSAVGRWVLRKVLPSLHRPTVPAR